ncbi:hypothetical protein BC828DRAFT_377789 [Blastocladiella britannica]|nr:hypothetical protein BC828DRAFT_377789 [Blastocladiella britannica]
MTTLSPPPSPQVLALVHTIHGLLEPQKSLWQESAARTGPQRRALPKAIASCLASITAVFEQLARLPQPASVEPGPSLASESIVIWLADLWDTLHRPSYPARPTVIDCAIMAWAVCEPPTITVSLGSPASLIVQALAVLVARRPDLERPKTYPLRAVLDIVDAASLAWSPIRSLLTQQVLAMEPRLESAPDPRPHGGGGSAKRARYDNTADLEATPPTWKSRTIGHGTPAPVASATARLLRELLAHPLLASLGIRMLVRVDADDPVLFGALADPAIAWATPLAPSDDVHRLNWVLGALSETELLERNFTVLIHILLRRVPVLLLIGNNQPYALLAKCFSQPAARANTAPLVQLVLLTSVPVRDLLPLMLALETATLHASKQVSQTSWLHHWIPPVVEQLCRPSAPGHEDPARLAAAQIFKDVTSTPKLAIALFRELGMDSSPVRHAIAAAATAVTATATANESDRTAALCEHHPSMRRTVLKPGFMVDWIHRWCASPLPSDVLAAFAALDFSSTVPLLARLQRSVLAAQAGMIAASEPDLVALYCALYRERQSSSGHLLVAVYASSRLQTAAPAKALLRVLSEVGPAAADHKGGGIQLMVRVANMFEHMTWCYHDQPNGHGNCPAFSFLSATLLSKPEVLPLLLYLTFHTLQPSKKALTLLAALESFFTDVVAVRRPESPASNAIRGHQNGLDSFLLVQKVALMAHQDSDLAGAFHRTLRLAGQLAAPKPSSPQVLRLHRELVAVGFAEFDRLNARRAAGELLVAISAVEAQAPARTVSVASLEQMVASAGINLMLVPASLRRSPAPQQQPQLQRGDGVVADNSSSDWTVLRDSVAATALQATRARLTHLARGLGSLLRDWHVDLSDGALLGQIVTRIPMRGVTSSGTGVSVPSLGTVNKTPAPPIAPYTFPNPYLLQLLTVLGLGPVFLQVAGADLARSMATPTSVPRDVIDQAFTGLYAMLATEEQPPAGSHHSPLPLALAVTLIESVLFISPAMYPAWRRVMQENVPRYSDVSGRDFGDLARRVLIPVEQRANADLWWCAVEGLVRAKVPPPPLIPGGRPT